MAIEIKTSAADTASINNEMLFVVYESTKANDPVTYPDYSYVCDVYVDSTLVERLIARPDPTYKMGIFDISKALQPYATYGLNLANSQIDYNARVSYRLKFGEQYDGVLYTNITVDSSDRYAFKSYIQRPFSSNSNSLTNGILSNRPSVTKYHRDQVYNLLPIFSNVSGITDYSLKEYNSSGGLLSTTSINMGGYVENTIRQFNLFGLVTINSSASYLEILDGGSNLRHRVDLLCETKYPAHTIVWCNRYGAYESQSFGLVSKKTIETQRKTYARTPWEINASGTITYESNDVFYGSRRGFSTITNTKLLMTSHLLTGDEYEWLSDMFRSPEVYLYLVELGKMLPVIVSEIGYEYRTYANSRLTPLQITVEFSDMYNSQFL